MAEKTLPVDNNSKIKELISKPIDYSDLTFPKDPQPNPDIPLMQKNDIEEKIGILEKEAEMFSKDGSSLDGTYKRLTEACVRHAIALDRINVIGRESLRAKRKTLLMKIDDISNNVVDNYEKHKQNSAPQK